MKVCLRPLTQKDAYTSIKWRQDPSIWRYTLAAGRQPPTIEDELAWIKKVIAEPTSRRLAIMVDDAYVGNVYLTGIGDGSAEFHIVIGDPGLWGRGIAGEATRQALAIAWNDLKLRRVHLIVHHENLAAVRMYEALGFAKEGRAGDFVQMSLLGRAPQG